MPFLIIVIGVVLIITAYRNTFGDLAAGLKTDIAGYFKWGGAIALILGLGVIPGMRTPSRLLLALVAAVVIVRNYQAMLNGFKNFAQTGAAQTGQGTPAPTPAAAFIANPTSAPEPTQAEIQGSSGTGNNATPAANPLTQFAATALQNPASYVSALEAGFGAANLFGSL